MPRKNRAIARTVVPSRRDLFAAFSIRTAASWHRRQRALCGAVVLLTLFVSPDRACLAQQTSPPVSQQDSEPLAEKINDPTASLTQVQIKDIFTPAEYSTNARPNTVQVRAIFAIRPLSWMPWEQLVRPTIKVVTVPNGKGASTSTAYDDMQLLDLFVMPWPNSKETSFRWGFGPYFVFPTSTSNLTGDGAWELGPAAAFSYRGFPGLNIAGLLQQATSFAYSSSKSTPITSLTFQPVITYQIGQEWYVKSSDATWTFNLRRKTSTTMPLSAGFGKVWKPSEGYAIDTSISGEWMVYRQFSTRTEQFSSNFLVSLVLPKPEF